MEARICIYSRRYGEAVFTRTDECQDVNVGNSDCPIKRLQDEFGACVCVVISFILDIRLVDGPAGVTQDFSTFFLRFLP